MRFLPFAVSLGIDDDLVFLINHRYAVVPLDYSMVGRHLGALRVGDIALSFIATGADVLGMGLQKLFDLTNLAFERGQLLVVLFSHGTKLFSGVSATMTGDDLLGGSFVFLLLVQKFFVGATPLFGSIGRELAAVDGKGLFANQSQGIGVDQHIAKDAGDFFVQARNKIGDGGEMRLAIGGKRFELDVALAGFRQARTDLRNIARLNNASYGASWLSYIRTKTLP